MRMSAAARRRPRSRLAGAAAIGLMAATALLVGPASVVARDPERRAAEAAVAIDLTDSLARDGTYRGAPGLSGTVDTKAWTLVSNLAAGEAPRFARAGVTAATPTGPWTALGSNGAGNGALWNAFFVRAIVVSGSNIYVGGLFENAAGIPQADNVAKWNGTSWSALGSNGAGTNGALDYGPGLGIYALTLDGTDLYVGGSFTAAADIPGADYVAKWNGSAWSELGATGVGAAISGRVWALALAGAKLYLGGDFFAADGIAAADYVAAWDVNTGVWSALATNPAGDSPITGFVAALVVTGSNVYVGGAFLNAATLPTADYVAKWNGSSWSALGSNVAGTNGALNAQVFSLAPASGGVFVGGHFTDGAGLATADYIAKWNGSAWSALGSNGAGNGALNWDAWELAVSGTDLYVGGGYSNAALIPAADYVAKWNGSSWSALGTNGNGDGAINAPVWALAEAGGGRFLYVGGDFDNVAGMLTADRVARWYLPPFTDIAGTSFEADIIWVYQQGITSGCSPTLYCPLADVTRGEMASFLARALNLPSTTTDYFTDDETSSHEANINRVASAGITSGCAVGKFCPTAKVTRGEMASFLARALGLPSTANDYFTDDETSSHEANINRLRFANLTSGCTPTTYCPTANVTRGQMAAFLHRAF